MLRAVHLRALMGLLAGVAMLSSAVFSDTAQAAREQPQQSQVSAELRMLNADQIQMLLSDRFVEGEQNDTSWVSWFSTTGDTTFSQNRNRPTSGFWKTINNQYCSQWPPAESWDCYDVRSNGKDVEFVGADDNDIWPGQLVANKPVVLAETQQILEVGAERLSATVPEGFELELLNRTMELPRVLHFYGEQLFVGSRSGRVYWLQPPYTTAVTLASLRDYPHSVVVHDGLLLVATTSAILATPLPQNINDLDAATFTTIAKLPGGRGHNSRTLKVAPDGELLVTLGITGNCSNEYLDTSYPFKDQRGGFFQVTLNPDNPLEMATLTPYASGLRNPVGFDWHPITHTLYATNNGPDHLGYEHPGEYFSAVAEGSFHGMPWYQLKGDDIVRDTCIRSEAPRPVADVVKPVATFPARNAPMDMAFVGVSGVSDQLAGDAIVALHGSWATSDGGSGGDPASRREPALVRVDFDRGEVVGVSNFVSGFQLENGARWARPMGVAIGPDGHIYMSSDGGINGLFRIKRVP